jgi:stress response protein YsnF
VVISKEAVEHTEHVADTVRREEVAIEDDPRVDEVNP